MRCRNEKSEIQDQKKKAQDRDTAYRGGDRGGIYDSPEI